VYDKKPKKPITVTLKAAEHNLVVRSGKSKAEVIVIKDCAVEAKY